jgi:outer membrane receptor protein involved in Fe transport
MHVGAKAALAALFVGTLVMAGTTELSAQGVTTGAITGVVTNTQGQPVAGVQVTISNRATGYTTNVLTRANGLYLVQGLEVGGPYTVSASSVGYSTVTREDVYVRLSTSTRIDFEISVQAVALEALSITVARSADFSPTRQGVSSAVSDTLLRRIPTVSRDFVELLKLTPQVARPASGAASAGGAYNRFNVFTIDGANQSERFNLGSTEGIPGGSSGGRMVSIDAVKEFRVLMTPTDVRQGNFTGMLVNAVTRSGTNEFHGGASYSYRNEDFSAEILRTAQLSIKSYGFRLGGPILRDRLHFFIAPEWQQRETPAGGPYYTASGTGPEVPSVPRDSLARIAQIMQSVHSFDVGTTGPLELSNPLTNLFGRLDFSINQNHRLVFRQLINRTEDGSFSRNNNSLNTSPTVQNSGYRLGSNQFNRVNKNRSSVLQLYSNFSGGSSNELIMGYNTIRDLREVPVRAPEVSVGVLVSGTSRAVTFGTEQFSPNNLLDQDIFEVVNNFTMPIGRHTVTFGGRLDHTKIFNSFAQRSYGVYVFPTIAALQSGSPTGYSIGYDNSGTNAGIPADFAIRMYSLYAQDQWAVNDKLTLTYGLRADIPHFLDKPLQNDSLTRLIPELRTDVVPKTTALWSPRIGFNYDPTGDRTNQIRGNVGIFTGPPPYILLGNAFANTGLGLVTLSCTGTATPQFTMNVDNLPRSCAGQAAPAPGQAGTAGINLTDPDFKYPQYLAASLGFDRQLPANFVLTVEGMYRKAINGVLVRDLNLRGPRMAGGQPYTDRHGRVLYADTILANGNINNNNQRRITTFRGVSFSEGLIEVSNQSEDYNYTISGQLARRFSDAFEATVGYTYMRSRDVQSLTSDRAISNWRNGRQLSESHDELVTSPSVFERPHRVIAYGTYTLPWKLTDVSFYYEGMSGFNMTYVALGDLNGDGYNGNDPIYVPRNAADANEVRIGTGTGTAFQQNAAMAQAFDDFISSQKCLDDQRGSIMKRDSCLTPFQHRFDVSLRQSLPAVRGQQLTVRLDVQNFLNFLNNDWGRIEVPTLSNAFPDQRVLIQQGRNPGPLNQSIPTFTFDSRLNPASTPSGAREQNGPFSKFANTTGFYRLQLSVNWSF